MSVVRRFLSRVRSLSHGKNVPYPAPRLKDLILFVTDRCNMRCEHCMFWRRLESPGPELSVGEIERVARSIPPLRTVSLTGGEPFLRRDLWEIICVFLEINQTHHVQVDTNGLMSERMLEVIEQFAALQPARYFTLQVSLDGLEATHDRLRQSPGSYKQVLSTLRACRDRQDEVPYFRVVVLTNVNQANHHEIEPLAEILSGLQIPHVYDFIRGARSSAWCIPKEIRVEEDPRRSALPPVEDLQGIVDRIAAVHKREKAPFDQWMTQLRWQVELYGGRRPPFPCLSAGRTAGVVFSDGAVAACEFTRPFARLSDYDFDLGRLWTGPEAGQRRSQITHCYCAHSCFLLTSHQEHLEMTGQVPAFAPKALQL